VAGDFDAYMDAFEAVAAEGRWMGAEAPIDRDGRRAGFDRAVAGDGSMLVVADAGGEIVGAIYGSLSGGNADFGMFVVESHRGGGVGRALLEAVVDWARVGGAHKVSLAAWPTNHPAIGLYASAGFQIEGTRRRHYRRRNGALWDSVVMGLVLDTDSPAGPGRSVPVPVPIVVPDGGIRRLAGGVAGAGRAGVPADGVIGADVVVLRPWRRSDAPAIVALVDDPVIRQWLPLPDPYTVDDAEEYIAGSRVGLTSGAAATLSVVVAGRVAGAVSLRLDATDRATADIGYWVGADARGRGVAATATRLLTEFGFDTLGLRRVELNAAAGNAASRRVAEKAGFELEGIRRSWRLVDGVPADFAVYSRLVAPA
jgi:RimJ/RimL family protein N-acetyltransferase